MASLGSDRGRVPGHLELLLLGGERDAERINGGELPDLAVEMMEDAPRVDRLVVELLRAHIGFQLTWEPLPEH